MWSFLSDLFRHPGVTHTVVVLDSEEVGRTRRYQLNPKHMMAVWGGSLLLIALLAASVVAFTPLRTYIPGYGTEELRRNARLNAIRVAALQDSVAVQQHYIKRLQQLVTGQVDSVARTTAAQEAPAEQPTAEASEPSRLPTPSRTDDARQSDANPDQQQPAIAPTGFSATARAEGDDELGPLPRLSLPMDAPVETGFPTRNFDAGDSHFGIDLAVPEGTRVRAVGEGYVVFADWTQGGGDTIAIQHSDGYLSVYKHNKRLLKETGDHVQAREALAVSGNSGEVTTGPHLHFELWRNGLAQDPRPYVTGW